MKVSYKWLKELVDFSFPPDELAERLTNLGLEVKEIEPFGRLKKVVVGKIVSIQNHPNADRLKVVRVDTGGETIPLVCGAPNIKEGILVPIALEGAVIHGGIKVGKVKIRGVESLGMICSEDELGLGEDRSGIMILPSHLRLGANLSEALGLDDFVLDFEITSNRADCLSVIGIAREISALTGNTLRPPSCRVEREESTETLPEIQIMDLNSCPYYSACLIRGVKVEPSPLWLRQRLLLMGGKPINNVVDVTNYVMWETGQPLHPFDYSSIVGQKIIIRRAKRNEVLITLDGVQRELNENMLVIADAKRAIALAGIMGGEDTQVQERTQDVLLESAYFDPISIRRTSMRLNLTTEASYRFERGVNPSGVKEALNRASFLLQKITSVKLEGEIIERGKLPERKNQVFLRPSRVNRILGGGISASRMRRILEGLQFKVKENKDGWEISIPSFRKDIEREIDLIEEIARFYGYNRLRVSLPSLGDEEEREDVEETVGERARQILKGLGFYEVIGLSLVSEDFFKKASLSVEKGIRIRNPLSNQQRILKTHLFPYLLEVVSYNLNQGIEECRIFELGNIYKRKDDSFQEVLSLTGLVLEKNFDFFSIKGIVEALLEGLSVEEVEFVSSDFPYLSPKQRAAIRKDGINLGVLGRVSDEIAKNYKLSFPPYLFEFKFSLLVSLSNSRKKFKPLPRFPSVRRDLALVVKEEIAGETVKRAILECGAKVLEKVEFFDLYRGESVPQGYKSLAYSLIFRAPDRTLKDEEVDKVQQNIIKLLREKLGARLRAK